MIAFACPHCGAPLRIDDSMAGRSEACPGCSLVVQVPAAAERASSQRTLHPPAAAEDTAPAIPDSLDLAPSPDYPFLASPQDPDELGRLGPYRVLKVLGTGAMGVVFQAEDPHLKRMVALKVMRPALAASAEFHRRFLREARLSASIDHEHIVTIYQVGEDRGVPFLAMQMLQGETLENRLDRAGGRLPLAEVLRVGREVAEGLAAAHARGLIHRDIKPANVWLEKDRGRVRIVDFGLARGAEPDAQFTQAGAVIGTPAYMAPEQAVAAVVDARSDLFSLGAVLYRAATGESPFGGKDTLSVLSALATRTPTPPHRIVPSLPRMFSGLVMRLLAKDPADRPQSATEVVEAIEALERGDADEAAVASVAEVARPQSRTRGEPASPPPSAARGKGMKSKGPSKARPRASRKGKRPPARRDWGPLVLTVGVALLVVAALFLFVALLLRAR
ncbi:MAG TPA: serine/threonine protein kinase [Planctomycetales bacterium]|nr:serine/threonine protein kinase [Planctomycetales bacterium]